MICIQGQRVLRSGKEKDQSDRCWGKAFSVNELGEGIFLCIRHYDKSHESNETTGAYHLAKKSGNFGFKSNGKVPLGLPSSLERWRRSVLHTNVQHVCIHQPPWLIC